VTPQRRVSTNLARSLRVHDCWSGQTITGVRRRMISRICALWLVTLILLPFTAPFKTYDLGTSSSHRSLDWLPKDNTDSDEKLPPPSDWFLIPRELNTVRLKASVPLSRIEEHQRQYTLLRL